MWNYNIEFKRPGGQTTYEQACKQGELGDRGLLVYICCSVEDALRACEQAILRSRALNLSGPPTPDKQA
jgi:hypothetical protein